MIGSSDPDENSFRTDRLDGRELHLKWSHFPFCPVTNGRTIWEQGNTIEAASLLQAQLRSTCAQVNCADNNRRKYTCFSHCCDRYSSAAASLAAWATYYDPPQRCRTEAQVQGSLESWGRKVLLLAPCRTYRFGTGLLTWVVQNHTLQCPNIEDCLGSQGGHRHTRTLVVHLIAVVVLCSLGDCLAPAFLSGEIQDGDLCCRCNLHDSTNQLLNNTFFYYAALVLIIIYVVNIHIDIQYNCTWYHFSLNGIAHQAANQTQVHLSRQRLSKRFVRSKEKS